MPADESNAFIAWEQVQYWPKGAIGIFEKAGWIAPVSTLAEWTGCTGCEENCAMPVEILPAKNGKPTRAFVVCGRYARVEIPLKRLQQWQLTESKLAYWVSSSLGLRSKPEKGDTESYELGTIKGEEHLASLELDFSDPISLKASGHSRSLDDLVYFKDEKLVIDMEMLFTMIDLPPDSSTETEEPHRLESTGRILELEIGTLEWRRQTARKAADTRHAQPGGSRDKQQRIRDIWATGKYPSKNRCAEKECEALGISFSTARRALKNMPAP
uniref:Uncharacterized protein n=1 Tax=Candidatus Kentrum sp. UNK TaxID=2126344 RepID=A0A451AQF5_9GAMM|nr:MAG: hypothetical protein BECKUNK1418G_GA0071005_100216 [Candidatus Kentron sp. UNK]VFK68257.1 MAG: hypothetical protein BECKUNK1418H_GA0071006_100116 [Candidatus Kentron sp. UNK]